MLHSLQLGLNGSCIGVSECTLPVLQSGAEVFGSSVIKVKPDHDPGATQMSFEVIGAELERLVDIFEAICEVLELQQQFRQAISCERGYLPYGAQ